MRAIHLSEFPHRLSLKPLAIAVGWIMAGAATGLGAALLAGWGFLAFGAGDFPRFSPSIAESPLVVRR